MNEPNSTKAERDPIDILEVNLKSVVDELTSHATSPDKAAHEVKPSSRMTKAIKDYPLLAIGIAFGAGFVLMRLLRRSLRRV
jgi:hypothetical protein